MPSLRTGQTFALLGIRWRVAYVNESRAHCVATTKHTVTVRSKGRTRTFNATDRKTLDISPNSIVTLEVSRG
jgi:hypothetical protein